MTSVFLPATRRGARRRLSGRTALLLGSALLPMVMASAAQAQTGETVVLEEGRTPAPVNLGAGDDRLVVDISHINADTGVLDLGGLVSGPLTDAGGNDTVWLRATGNTTHDVAYQFAAGAPGTRRDVTADGTPFEGGAVYEASGNDTVLTLQNTSRSTRTPPTNDLMDMRHGPLRLAGDGTVVVGFSIQADNQLDGAQTSTRQQAIRVEGGSTLQDQGGNGDGRLAVVVEGGIGGGETRGGLIDVQNAASLKLATGSRVSFARGIGILGGESEIVLGAGSWIEGRDGTSGNVTGIRSSGRVVNSGKITIGGASGSTTALGTGVFLDNGKLYNILDVNNLSSGVGQIYGGVRGVLADSGVNYVENFGLIQAATGAAIENSGNVLVTRNRVTPLNNGTSRAGEIRGGIPAPVPFAGVAAASNRQAYKSGGLATDVLVNSGIIDGNVSFGAGASMFLYTGDTNGVAGQIDGGSGRDAYGKSFSASATHNLSNAILNQDNNSQFEMHGIEASGPGTTVTVAAAGDPLNAGLMLIGDGTVINTANINADWGVWARDIAGITGGLAFDNRGEIRATELGYRAENNTRSFTNSGLISAESASAVQVRHQHTGSVMPVFNFTNSGTIASAASGGSAAYFYFEARGPEAHLADFTNSGVIRQTGSLETFGDNERFALEVTESNALDHLIRVMNSGTIESTGGGISGLGLEGSHFEVTNDTMIRATGMGAGGLRISTALDSTQPRTQAFLFNSGTISATGDAWIDDELGTAVSYGAVFDFRGSNGGDGTVSNSGLIEATGTGAVALAAMGNVDPNITSGFVVDNRGIIRGGQSTEFGDPDQLTNLSILSEEQTRLAGAIHTRNTADQITNRGTIEGDVYLGELGDAFYNYGALNGNVMLGGASDSFTIGSGASLSGTVDGGVADWDVLYVDRAGSDTKRINFSQFKNFEALTTTGAAPGTGIVSVLGNIDQQWMRLRAITIHIEAGATVGSGSGATGYTFADSMERSSEAVNNAGTIVGGVSLGAGEDSLINSGTIGFDVDMGADADTVTNSGTINGNVNAGTGNDTVTNSGTINGNLNLGTGDDRYVAESGGVVTGAIDGGDGIDTFVFRLNGNSGSIPGGFTNFESFGAYGPGTLTLALDQDYDTIELFETANLTLTDGPGTVGQIKGDDSAQIVTIEDADFAGGVSLAGGDDTLSMHLDGALGGALDGGDGTDTLKLHLDDFSSINDLFNFEIVDVTGSSPLRLLGTLGAGQRINFDGSDNRFIVDADAVFEGNANGGDGTDTLEVYTGNANNRTIVAGQITSFEKLIAGGTGTLALNGQAYSFESVDVAGNLAIGNGASLASASGVQFGDGDNRLTLEGTGTVTSPVDGGDGIDTIAFDLAAGQTRALSSLGTISNFEILAASGAGTLNIDQNAAYQAVSIEGGHLNVLGGATLTAPVNGGATADRLTVSAGGTLAGAVNLGGGDDVVTNAGTITGDVNLGDGNDRYVAQAGGVVTGTIDGGAGDNTFVFRLEGSLGNIPGSVLNFNSFGVYGPGTLTVNLDQGQSYQNLEILEGANLVLAGTNGSVANVIGDNSAQSVTIDGRLTGSVSLGGGDDSLTMHLSGLLEGALDGGDGTDTLNLTLDGASSINGMFGFETANITGASPLTLTGNLGANQRVNFTGNTDNELIIAAGATFAGTVDGGGGRDLLRVQSGNAQSRTVVASQILSFEDLVSEGAGTLVLSGGAYSFDNVAVNGGNLELGAGSTLGTNNGVVFDGADNRFTLGSGASVIGRVDGGAGNDTLALVQGAGTTRLLSSVDQTGFERLESSGSGNGELRIDRSATFTGGVGLDGGVFNVTAGNTLTANVTGGANRDSVRVGGRIEGNLDLGAGDDFLSITGAGAITGTRSGGDGTDTLAFNTSGTVAAPTAFDAGAWTGFEALNVEGGVVSLTGTGSYATVNVAGGRLIGQAGSVITATSPIEVARGATFGSAGRVNGDILVLGTLSPGASPGTMTVNGNVNFQPGSNLLLEVSPTVSDLLNISGTLTIANGATMDITGVLHGSPGNRLDLVVAQGGITGRFTTINKSNDIFGFVVQNGNRLQIQSEFLNGDYPTNISASIDYANEVLRGGYGVQAFTAALPVLVDAQGAIRQQAFAQLTPEAYGSAIQLGEENSLLIVDGVHGATATRGEGEGLYTFGQFLAGRADVAATNGLSGASASRITNRGFFAGLGYGLGEGTQVGAFVGGLDSKQVIRWLGAKTEIDALAGGVFADTRLGGFGVHGLVAVNGGKAETRRDLLVNDGTGKAKYDLTSWIADLGIDYALRFGPWTIAPRLGVTYVRTSRGAAKETGLGDFSLSVDKGSRNSWFGEAAVAASGSFDLGGAKFTPYAQIGVRQMMGDARVPVTGQYTGADSKVTVLGIEREGTAARVALGLGVDLSEGVRLQAGYSGEFSGTKRNSVMGGLAVRF